MARTFTATSYLEINSAVLSSRPLSILCRFNPSALSGQMPVVSICDKDVANHYVMVMLRGDSPGDPLQLQIRAGSDTPATNGFRLIDTANSITAGVINTAVAVLNTTTDNFIVLNGDYANRGSTASTSTFPSNLDRSSIGRLGRPTPIALASDCDIAEVVFLSGTAAVLSEAQIDAWHAGFTIEMISPGAWVERVPIMGNASPELGLKGTSFTLTGTASKAAHPRVIEPWARPGVKKIAAAGTTVARLVNGGLLHGGTLTSGRLVRQAA